MQAKHLQKTRLTEKADCGRAPDDIVRHEKLLHSRICIRGRGRG